MKKYCLSLSFFCISIVTSINAKSMPPKKFVELQALLKKTREDLKERLPTLNRKDKQEIIKIIKEKEKMLVAQLQAMRKSLKIKKNPNDAIFSSWNTPILIAGGTGITVGMLLTFLYINSKH